MFLVCPFCTDTDDVVREKLGPGLWHYTCTRSEKHPDR